jgi:hypothetical protein
MEQRVLTTFVVVDYNFLPINPQETTDKNGLIHLRLMPTVSRQTSGVQISTRRQAKNVALGDWVCFGKQPFIVTQCHERDKFLYFRLGHNLILRCHEDTTLELWIN